MTKPTMPAIETEYAGHLFRSRLEARWAVFFDAMGIDWVYEPQGYHLGNGDKYLPDFWLPNMYNSCWVEVKGAVAESDLIKLWFASCAEGLPLTYESGKRPSDILEPRQLASLTDALPRILLLGDIPQPRSGIPFAQWMTVLTAGGPAMQRAFWWGQLDLHGRVGGWRDLSSFTGSECPVVAYSAAVEDALDAARQARFEHGESGRPRRLAKDDLPAALSTKKES